MVGFAYFIRIMGLKTKWKEEKARGSALDIGLLSLLLLQLGM